MPKRYLLSANSVYFMGLNPIGEWRSGGMDGQGLHTLKVEDLRRHQQPTTNTHKVQSKNYKLHHIEYHNKYNPFSFLKQLHDKSTILVVSMADRAV